MTRYLVTGGAGFIGSHLVDALLARGDQVIALDNLSTGRVENLTAARQHEGFELVHGSVLDFQVVDEAVREVDTVVHLAAAVGVKLIVDQPLRSLITNVRGTEIVFDAAHRHRRKVVVASTSEIYGRNSEVPLAEDASRVLGSPEVVRWSYSTSKAVDEILAFAYHHELGLPTAIARLFNTVGPRQSPAYGMVIPRLVDQVLDGAPLTVYGDGSQRRCFCHVRDVVRALLSLLDDPRAEGAVFNVGSTEEVSILELARRIRERAGSSSPIRLVPYEEAYAKGFEDMMRRVPDTSKLHALTGWAPTVGLDGIIDETLAEVRAERATRALRPSSPP